MVVQSILRKLIAHHCCDWMGDKLYLKLEYYARIGEKLSLSNPVSFNQKLQWLKIHNRDPRATVMVLDEIDYDEVHAIQKDMIEKFNAHINGCLVRENMIGLGENR